MLADPILTVRNLSKTYEPSPLWLRTMLRSSIKDPVVALDGVDLDLDAGRLCVVIGPNGAGKSTLFRVLTGLTTPTSGTATVAGIDCTTRSASLRRAIGFMAADERSLFLRHTCRENLRFHGRLHGIERVSLEERIVDMLDRVGLRGAEDRVGIALSAGMRARLQLARALLHRPKLLILDEPTGSVDPVGSFELLRLIRDIAVTDDTSVLLSSHRLEEIEALQDNVVFLSLGRVVHSGPLDEWRRLWETPRLRLRFASASAATAAADRIGARLGAMVSRSGDVVIDVTTRISAGRVLAALDGDLDDVLDVGEVRLSLGEAMTMAAARGTEHHERRDARSDAAATA
jgi:ABC-2 type transport system ATP-binding protein